MAEKTDPLLNWTYPDFPKPDNEVERISRITELSLNGCKPSGFDNI